MFIFFTMLQSLVVIRLEDHSKEKVALNLWKRKYGELRANLEAF